MFVAPSPFSRSHLLSLLYIYDSIASVEVYGTFPKVSSLALTKPYPTAQFVRVSVFITGLF